MRTLRSLPVVVLVACAACGGAPPVAGPAKATASPVAPTAAPAVVPPPPWANPPDAPCDPAEACAEEAARLLAKGGDLEPACAMMLKGCAGGSWWACLNFGLAGGKCREATRAPRDVWFARACDLGGGDGCAFRAADARKRGDLATARDFLGRGCALPDARACYDLARMRLAAEGGPMDAAGAASAATAACNARLSAACLLLGDLRMEGRGTPKDDAAAWDAYARACKAGEKEGCERAFRLRGQDATFTAMGRLATKAQTVDGVAFELVFCDTADYGADPVALLRAVAAQRAALDACSKRKAETPVELKADNGALLHVRAAGTDAPTNRCVERALEGKPSEASGRCTINVLYGGPAAHRP